MLELRPAHARGTADHGWLKTAHSFSFADYFDPEHVEFGALRVINEDFVAPGTGFPTHGHRDMEIITYILDGALEHRDSLGNGSVIRPGEVQRMSAGTGVLHSERNPSATETVHLLQIWLHPSRQGLQPSYEQKFFPAAEKRGRLRLVADPAGADGAVTIHQDARLYAGLFDGDESARLTLAPGRQAYVHLARGRLIVNGQPLTAGDGLKVRETGVLNFTHGDRAEVLVFDLPEG
jgi:redox-sensitive bicupin YhaK (pirin superfamily)